MRLAAVKPLAKEWPIFVISPTLLTDGCDEQPASADGGNDWVAPVYLFGYAVKT
jgi:hypothetical protein